MFKSASGPYGDDFCKEGRNGFKTHGIAMGEDGIKELLPPHCIGDVSIADRT